MTLQEACTKALRSIGVEAPNALTLIEGLGDGWNDDLSEVQKIESIARAFNVRVRRVKLPQEAWTPDHGAFISFQVTEYSRKAIALLPGIRVKKDMAQTLEPFAYFFHRPLPQQPLSPREFFAHLSIGTARDICGLILVGLFVCALGLTLPSLTAMIFDSVVPTRSRDSLLAALLVMGAFASSVHLFEFSATLLRLRLHTRLSHTSKASIMDRILALPTTFFRHFPVGSLLTRSGIADAEQERLLISAFTGFFSGLFSVSNLLVLFWLDARIGFISLAAGGIISAAAIWAGIKKMRLERAIIEATSKLRSFLFQILGGISKVRAAGAESRAFSRWSELFQQRQLLRLNSSRISNSTTVFHSILPLACTALFFIALGTGDFTLTPGRYLAIVSAFALFISGMLMLANAVSDLACALPLLERARPILQAPLERSHRGRSPGALSGHIELRDLCFRYSPETPLVLKDVSAKIEPGQFVALVGPSGSGKTSLVRLLLGFEQPSSGQILYDGVALSELDIFEVRHQIGTVLQHDHLMSGNIFENIAAVRPITHDQAWDAARIAGLEQDLARMPMGMHSFVTPGGRAFSGGERQRMMIARAVAGKPRILLFDEATSALDNRVQAEVMRNLENLKVTRIVVAHRLSTIRNADIILVFDQGRLVESGDFNSLVALDGLFAQLARRQSV